MSGRHAVVRRQDPPLILKPVRAVWSAITATWDWAVLLLAEALETLFERSEPDVWADYEDAAPAPADVLPQPSPAVAERPAPVVERLSRQDALLRLHGEHPELPGGRLSWRPEDGTVHGEVRALEGTAAEKCAIVVQYAAVLDAGVVERLRDPAAGGLVVSASGIYAGVAFLVEATLCSVPTRIYEEARQDPTLDDTQTTQHIPDSVIRQVMAA